MSIQLYLMRHAEPESGEPLDPTREITSIGKKQIEDMATFMVRQIGRVDLTIASWMKRAQQTAVPMAAALGCPTIENVSTLDPDGDPVMALEDIELLAGLHGAESILVIGHHPLVNNLLQNLCGVKADEIHFRHSMIAHIDLDAKQLHWFIGPTQVERDEEGVINEALKLTESLLEDMGFRLDEKKGDQGTYYYDTEGVKRWVLGGGGNSGNCDLCEENADAGWIPEDDEFPNADAPPQHPNCFPSDSVISAAGVSQYFKRWFEGEFIVIRVPGVDYFAVTPNHPVLTRRGWMAARLVQVGDEVAQCTLPDAFSLLNPDNNYVEASVEQIARSLLVSGGVLTEGVPSSSIAFHGDGQAKGKIDIIRAARSLMGDRFTGYGDADKQIKYTRLAGRHPQRVPFALNGAAAQLIHASRHTANGVMSGGGSRGSQFGGHLLSPEGGGLTTITLAKPELLPMSQNSRTGYSNPVRDCQQALAGQMRLVKVFEVNVRKFSGHVFNLETQNGFYSCNSIVTHNCDCTEEAKEKRVRVYV